MSYQSGITAQYRILMATHNGELFLRDQLKSIEENPGWIPGALFVSDDQSTDLTRAILRQNRIDFIEGPASGAKDNFAHLIKNSGGADLYFLSDQDDVWMPHKIDTTLSAMPASDIPTLLASSVKTLRGKVVKPKMYGFPVNLMRNKFQGCTFCLNESLRDLVSNTDFGNAIMHDWWIVLLATAQGKIKIEKEPLVTYRIHEKNTVGFPNFSLKVKRYVHSLVRQGSRKDMYLQAESLLPYARGEDYTAIKLWMDSVNSPALKRISYVLTNLRIFMADFSTFGLVPLIVSGSYKHTSIVNIQEHH